MGIIFFLLITIYGYIIYMEYTVYRLENIVTKKNYIGMTSLEPKRRWRGEYGGKMKEAIDAYPLQLCWKKSIEFQTPNKEQALELESELMKWYDSVEYGYNTSSYDSMHYERTEEHGKKISKSLTGKHHTEETKKRIRENNPSKKPVLQFSKDGIFIAEYSSIGEAERLTGCYHQHISKCCKGKLKSTGGFIWKYKEGI